MPETDGSFLVPVDPDMHPLRIVQSGKLKPGLEKAWSNTRSLNSGEQIHVQMRRIWPPDLLRHACGMMDHVSPSLIRRPLRHERGARAWILCPQGRPPLLFKPILPRRSIENAKSKAGHSLLIQRKQDKRWFQNGIGSGVDEPNQFRIDVKVRCVSTHMSRCRRYRIKVAHVFLLEFLNGDHCL